jgi:hypothetical protein
LSLYTPAFFLPVFAPFFAAVLRFAVLAVFARVAAPFLAAALRLLAVDLVFLAITGGSFKVEESQDREGNNALLTSLDIQHPAALPGESSPGIIPTVVCHAAKQTTCGWRFLRAALNRAA